MNTVSCKMSYNLRRDISEKMHKLPLSYFEEKGKLIPLSLRPRVDYLKCIEVMYEER